LLKSTTQCPRPRLEPGPFDQETSALNMSPPYLKGLGKDYKMTNIFGGLGISEINNAIGNKKRYH